MNLDKLLDWITKHKVYTILLLILIIFGSKKILRSIFNGERK
jgi:hypothetical protein